jgi:Tfp pilus assembly protein PilV
VHGSAVRAGSTLALVDRMSYTRCLRKAAGFALIEVLVASTLLTVALLAAAHVLASAAAANVSAARTTDATVLAVDKIEQLRALPMDDPALSISPSDALTVSVEGHSDRVDSRFVRRWSVEALPSYPDDAVAIRVLVVDIQSARRVQLETIRSRKPLARLD